MDPQNGRLAVNAGDYVHVYTNRGVLVDVVFKVVAVRQGVVSLASLAGLAIHTVSLEWLTSIQDRIAVEHRGE